MDIGMYFGSLVESHHPHAAGFHSVHEHEDVANPFLYIERYVLQPAKVEECLHLNPLNIWMVNQRYVKDIALSGKKVP